MVSDKVFRVAKKMYKPGGALKKDGMHRPEGAGNFDNMDDHNIVESISLRQGTIEHTPANNKDILNKEFGDANYGSGTETDPIWLSQSGAFFNANSDVDHDATTNFVADEHVAHGGVTLTAGTGMTGGGTIASNRTFNVIGGTGITANANDIATDDSAIVHDNLSGFVGNEHIDWTSATNDLVTTGDVSSKIVSGGQAWADRFSGASAFVANTISGGGLFGDTISGAGFTIDNATASGANLFNTGDHNTSGAAYLTGMITHTSATPPTASNFPQGTIYYQYTA